MSSQRIIPASIEVGICPHHGPFVRDVDAGDLGCPEQVDYDGITCSERGTPYVVYTPASDKERGRDA